MTEQASVLHDDSENFLEDERAGDGDGIGRNGRPEVDYHDWQDPQTGRFVRGNPGGPGPPSRPVRRRDLYGICVRHAKKAGLDLDALLWAVVRGLFVRASRGDSTAAKLIFDRLCSPVKTVTSSPAVSINVGDAREDRGPPIPGRGDLGRYMQRLCEVSGDLIAAESAAIDAEIVDPVEEFLG